MCSHRQIIICSCINYRAISCFRRRSQTFWNATVESCPAGAVCWVEGNQTWTEMNFTTTDYQEKCKHASMHTFFLWRDLQSS